MRLREELDGRLEELEELRAELDRYRSMLPPFDQSPFPQPAPNLDPPRVVLKDLKIEVPSEFDGKTSEHATFIGSCVFYFINKPTTSSESDGNKVNFVMFRLHGPPSI